EIWRIGFGELRSWGLRISVARHLEILGFWRFGEFWIWDFALLLRRGNPDPPLRSRAIDSLRLKQPDCRYARCAHIEHGCSVGRGDAPNCQNGNTHCEDNSAKSRNAYGLFSGRFKDRAEDDKI